MIYLSGLDSIIESIYLSDLISTQIGKAQIFVNPNQRLKYLTNKTIIITNNDYSVDYINQLVDGGNKVISRVYFNTDKVEIQPYIIRINDKIRFNGREITEDSIEKIDDILLKGYGEYDEKEKRLYFPKIKIMDKETEPYMDQYGNLTGLGWALHQVGVNMKEGPLVNLDLLKLKKVII
jgi:hypothetical protein